VEQALSGSGRPDDTEGWKVGAHKGWVLT
jgi:hypothetical protein